MKYAVLASGGKQYKVNEGTVVELEKLKVAEGDQVTFDNVLLFVEDGIVTVGQPNVPGISVTAKVLGQIKARKIRVAKFKAKAKYRKVHGHRQHLTKVQIESIGKKSVKKADAKPVEEVTKTSKKAKA
jgi:large subunit ribosomal protein L21